MVAFSSFEVVAVILFGFMLPLKNCFSADK